MITYGIYFLHSLVIAQFLLIFPSGHPVASDDDYLIELAEAVVKNLRDALQPNSFLINLIPAC